MRSLYLRIYATVVAVLLLFVFVSGWVVQRHMDEERSRTESVASERLGAWAELLERSLPGAEAPLGEQAAAVRDWSLRLRVPLALDDAQGARIGSSDSFLRRSGDVGGRPFAFKLDDGRTLWTMRPGRGPPVGEGRAETRLGRMPPVPWPLLPPGLPRGTGLIVILLLLLSPSRPARFRSCAG